MNGVAQKSDGMSEIASEEFSRDEEKCGQKRYREKSVSRVVRMTLGAVVAVVHVHGYILLHTPVRGYGGGREHGSLA